MATAWPAAQHTAQGAKLQASSVVAVFSCVRWSRSPGVGLIIIDTNS